jgi:hypothetical protein
LRWLVPVTVLLAAAVVLAPSVLASYLSRRVSAAAGVSVHIGWLSWNPLAARVALHDITVAGALDAPPVVTVRSMAATIAVRRLWEGDVVLRRLSVKQPWVALRRTASGDFNLGALLGAPAAAPSPSASPRPTASASPEARAAPPGRSIVVEALRVSGGSIEFRDETTSPILETSLHLEDVAADDLTIALSGRTSAKVHLASRVEHQPLTLDLAYDAGSEGSRLVVDLASTGVSLARTLFYVPVGWRRVSGTLDLALTYRRELAGEHLRTHTLTGHASARDVALAEPWASEPTVRAAQARIGRIAVDFVQRRAELGAVTVAGFTTVIARDAAGLHVPFVASGEPAADSAWRTVIHDVTLGGGELVLRDVVPNADHELRATVRKGSIRTERDGVRIAVETTTSAGDVDVDVDTRVEDDATRMRFTLRDCALAELATRLRLPLRFATGTLAGTLRADVDGAGAHVTGTLQVPGGRTLPVDPARPEDVLAWQDLTLDIAEAAIDPPRLHLRRLAAEWPYVMIHRAASGTFPLTVAPPDAASGSPTPSAAGDASAPARDGPAVTIDDVALHHGRVEFYDTTLTPPYWTELSDSEFRAAALAYAPLAAAHVALRGAVDELAPLRLEGVIAPAATRLDAHVEQLRLVPLNPYLEPILHYAVTSGVARIASNVTLAGAALAAENDVVLSRFGLARTGDDPFQRELGAPLSVALALMKDTRGDISLTIPVRGDFAAQHYEVRSLVSTAITKALLGTLRSPLTLLGAVFRRDEEERFDLKPVPFPAGSAVLAADGEERIGELARLLVRHAELDAVLIPDPSPADATALGVKEDDPVGRDRLTALADTRFGIVVERLVDGHHVARARLGQIPWTPGPFQPETLPGVDVQLRGR